MIRTKDETMTIPQIDEHSGSSVAKVTRPTDNKVSDGLGSTNVR